jgi:hypothetical protein
MATSLTRRRLNEAPYYHLLLAIPGVVGAAAREPISVVRVPAAQPARRRGADRTATDEVDGGSGGGGNSEGEDEEGDAEQVLEHRVSFENVTKQIVLYFRIDVR